MKGFLFFLEVFKIIIFMFGFFVDVYGLEEFLLFILVICFYLLYICYGICVCMMDIVFCVIFSYNVNFFLCIVCGFIVVVFDMLNYGSRMVSEKGNEMW